MTALDPGLRFLADLVAAEGGLYEERRGLLTCVVPDELRHVLDVGEELTVTADPGARTRPSVGRASRRPRVPADGHLAPRAGPAARASLPSMRVLGPTGGGQGWPRLPPLPAGGVADSVRGTAGGTYGMPRPDRCAGRRCAGLAGSDHRTRPPPSPRARAVQVARAGAGRRRHLTPRPRPPARRSNDGDKAAKGSQRRPPLDPGRHGDKLARDLWRSVFAGRRGPGRQVAAGSPLEALFRLYGQRALSLTIDIPPGLPLQEVRAATSPSRRQRAEVTTGTLMALGVCLPFTIRWRWSSGQAVPGEVLPFIDGRRAGAHPLPVWVHLRPMAPPPAWGDPVAAEIWALVGGAGFPTVARALAAWWETQNDAALAEVDPGEAARLVVEAVGLWPAANPVTKLLRGPDWWV